METKQKKSKKEGTGEVLIIAKIQAGKTLENVKSFLVAGNSPLVKAEIYDHVRYTVEQCPVCGDEIDMTCMNFEYNEIGEPVHRACSKIQEKISSTPREMISQRFKRIFGNNSPGTISPKESTRNEQAKRVWFMADLIHGNDSRFMDVLRLAREINGTLGFVGLSFDGKPMYRLSGILPETRFPQFLYKFDTLDDWNGGIKHQVMDEGEEPCLSKPGDIPIPLDAVPLSTMGTNSKIIWLGEMEMIIPCMENGDHTMDVVFLTCPGCLVETSIRFHKDGRVESGEIGKEHEINPADPETMRRIRKHEGKCPLKPRKELED